MIRNGAILLATALLTFSCTHRSQSVSLIEPDFVVRQTSTMPLAARHVTGAIPVTFQVDVINKSDENIVLEQLRLETIGTGAYYLPATSRPFGRKIEPKHVETVELLLNATAVNTIQGSNGPVTIRGTAYFDSQYGKFQKTFMQQINDGMKGQPSAE